MPRNRDRRADEDTFRFDRRVLGVRVTRRTGNRDWRQHETDNAILSELGKQGQEQAIRLFQKGDLTMAQLRAAHARGQLASANLVTDIALREKLWGVAGAFGQMLPRMGRSERSRDRYRDSIEALRRKAAEWLGPNAIVADLENVPWTRLSADWNASGSDWNRMRAMLSSFLTNLLNNKWHPFRHSVLAKIPRMGENERVCEISVAQFWKAVKEAPELVRPSFVTLVATGMRVGEYLACTPKHLNAETLTVNVPGDPTGRNPKKKGRAVQVAEWLWPFIEAAVPSPLQYKALRGQWAKAQKAIGVSGVRLHDLRHLKGQTAIEGADISEVADVLGHTQLSTTRRYTRHLHQEKVAKVVGRRLRPRGELPSIRVVGGKRT